MISSLGLKSQYENISDVRETCKKLMSIALMPMDDIEEAYSEVLNEVTSTRFTDPHVLNLMNDLMNYYGQEWIEEVEKEMDCMHNLERRTNNICEGTFHVLSSHDELCKILNDSLKSLRHTGETLKAANYYRQMSTQFDVGLDRISYVLKWIHENVKVDLNLNNTYDIDKDCNLTKDSDENHHISFKTCAKLETTPIPQIYDEEAIRFDLSKLVIAALPPERDMS
ncbi:unnamed protein product [Adineta steineri]|nr:unnamed protein product [Adineta steineri]